MLWRKPDWKIALAMVPSPLVIDGERVFFSGGYNNGSVMVRIKGDGDRIETEELFRLKLAVFGADQQTPILYDGHIYGITPPGELACLDLDGRRLWSSAPRRFGLGPFILADGLLFALNDEDGTLHVAEASPSGYQGTRLRKTAGRQRRLGPDRHRAGPPDPARPDDDGLRRTAEGGVMSRRGWL